MRSIFAFVALALLAALPRAGAAPGFVLVTEGQPQCATRADAAADPALHEAAPEPPAHVRRMTGAALPGEQWRPGGKTITVKMTNGYIPAGRVTRAFVYASAETPHKGTEP